MALERYRKKRDFSKTPEPRGRRSKSSSRRSFVIQKHDASRLHYDFRLELDGVLKSWAVPKGPCLDPSQKRLAVQVEDHPIEYADFEGVIPEGEYGGGTVLVWDRGTWTPEEDPERGLAAGALKFTLDGEKLHGSWALVRIRGRNDRDDRNWLLIKHDDASAKPLAKRDITRAKPKSVLTGRDLRAIAAAADRTWTSAHGAFDGEKNGARRGSGSGPAPAEKQRRAKPPTTKMVTRVRGGRARAKAAAEEESSVAGVAISHQGRVVYAAMGITKLDLARYYEQVGEWMLPHVADRPLNLLRCPAGPGKPCFFQRHAHDTFPRAVKSAALGSGESCVFVDSIPGIVALVQMGVLELHPWGSKVDRPDAPDRMFFDLDPDVGVPWKRVVETAKLLRGMLEKLGLESFAKTTGGKGLHLVVPLAPRATWDAVKQFSQGIAQQLARAAPDLYVATASKARRKNRVFIDYLRNARSASAVAAYSTRAKDGATVSTPIAWSEIDRVSNAEFDVATVPVRLEKAKKDPWPGFFKSKQRLSDAAIRSVRSSDAR